MECNVGRADRIIRIVIGLVLLGLGLMWGNWWGVIGAVPLLTAIIGWCPLYTLFGMSTCSAEEKKSTLPDTSSSDAKDESLK